METQATVLPGKQAKSQHVKPNFKRRTTLPPKSNDKDQPFVHRRVFGSIQNPNLQERTIPEKPKWRRPSLKPDQTIVPPKPLVDKTVPILKSVQNKSTSEHPQKPTTHVQTTPSKPKFVSKEPTIEPSPKLTKPVQTPLAAEAPKKPAPNSKSVPKTLTKPVHTNSPTPEMFNKTAHNLKSVPNETTTLSSPKTEKPVHSATFALEGPEKISSNLKMVQMEQTNVSSPKQPQQLKTPLPANVPQKTTLSPKTFLYAKISLLSPKAAQLVQTTPPESEKTTPNPNLVQNKQTTIPSPKPPLLVQTTQPDQDKTTTNPKPVQTKSILKLSPKPAQTVQSTTPVREVPKKTVSVEKSKNKKKSVSFPKVAMETPGVAKPRVSGTPYYTARRCSKCWFDRMESSSYWVGMIKLAENAEKHNVSAGLFSLALEAKAEPIRALKMELNQYMSRHGFMSGDPEWRKVTASYGLNVTPNDRVEVQAGENYGVLDQAHEDSVEENDKQLESNLEGRV